jgi:hypothetical protein
MAYLGIGYSGESTDFLRNLVDTQMPWLKGDRVPHFFGERFLVLYDSNTAREFAKLCLMQAPEKTISIYPMEAALNWEPQRN